MEQIKIREGRSELLIFLDKNFPDELSALKEARRLIGVEIIKYEVYIDRSPHRLSDSDKLPGNPGPDR